MGSELPAIKGLTVTVLPDTLTTLDAARLKSSASCDAPFEAMRNGSLGSRISLNWTTPKACPFAPTGVSVTPFTLPSSYTISAEL